MENFNRKCLVFFLALVSLPLVFTLVALPTGLEVWPLSGSWETPSVPKPTVANILNGSFQKKAEDVLRLKSGLKGFLIRFRNQAHYSLWGKIHSQKTIIGQKGYLYEYDHADAWAGTDFLGEKKIEEIVHHITKAKKILEAKKIRLLVALAPGKASYYPQFLPERYKKAKRPTNNYSAFLTALKKAQVPTLDLLDFTIKLPTENAHLVYPKYGTHWSVFAAARAALELQESVANLTGKRAEGGRVAIEQETHLPKFSYDSDIFNALNLLWSLPWSEYATPNVVVEKTKLEKANVVFVADSFLYGMVYSEALRNFFDPRSEFWYYDKVAFPVSGTSYETKLDDKNLWPLLEGRDAVVLLVSETNFKYFGYGFPERVMRSKNNTP